MTRKPKPAVKKPERSATTAKADGDGVEPAAVNPAGTPPAPVKSAPLPVATPAIVVGVSASSRSAEMTSAEVDKGGRPYLADQKWEKMGGTGNDDAPGMLDRVFSKLYGNLPREDRPRVAWLAGTLFFIIGGYWLLRSLKDAIVITTMGEDYIPNCKMMSLVVVLSLFVATTRMPTSNDSTIIPSAILNVFLIDSRAFHAQTTSRQVFLYNKLVDVLPKHQLFYVVGGFYFVLFSGIAVILADPVIGLKNDVRDPWRLIGWVSYCAIESFGSITVSLFWAFVNSSMNVEGAKSSYGLIIAGGNLGSILGPTIALTASQTGSGIPPLYAVGALCMGLMVVMIWGYVRIFGVDQSLMMVNKKKGAGVLEGFHLFLRYNYIKGIFAMSCLFMVEVTILDYMMKKLAAVEFESQFPDDSEARSKAFVTFTGLFGQVTNTISFGFSLLGTSMVIRRLGLKKTLLAFPSMCLSVVLMVMAFPDLYVVFLAMILLKGFSYSLNNPCKEILYQPTNSAVKFKCKSWIDIFGARMSKAAGSGVTAMFSSNVPGLVLFGGSVAAGGAAFLIWVAWQMGFMFDDLMETGKVVGGEKEENPLQRLPADEEGAGEDEAADTSCGVLEEGQAEEVFEVRGGDSSVGPGDSGDAESKKTSIDI